MNRGTLGALELNNLDATSQPLRELIATASDYPNRRQRRRQVLPVANNPDSKPGD